MSCDHLIFFGYGDNFKCLRCNCWVKEDEINGYGDKHFIYWGEIEKDGDGVSREDRSEVEGAAS